MSDEEKFKFCGTICMAARNLGIYGRRQQDYFVWFDPSVGRRWRTESSSDPKEVLFNACKSLTDYLCLTKP